MLGWSTQLGNKLFGPDPKLDFRKPGQGGDLLAGSRTFEINDPYWHQYVTLFDSPSDVLYLLPNALLLKTLHSNPRNLVTLLEYTSNRLFDLLQHPLFPQTEPSTRRDLGKECLNCIRVLTRLIPLLLGPQNGAIDHVEEEIFWKRSGSKSKEPTQPVDEPEGQFVLEDDEEDDQEAARPDEDATSSLREGPCLADRLIATLIHLLFVPGLTLPSEHKQDDSVVNFSIWEPGIALPFPTSPSPSTPNSVIACRFEILRLLTVLVSLPSLLTSPHSFPSVPNRFRHVLVTGQALERAGLAPGQDKNIILCLLCSVINTACQAGAYDNTWSSDAGGGLTSPGGLDAGGLRASATRFAVEAARRTQDAAFAGAGAGGTGSNHANSGGSEDVKSLLIGTCLQFLGIVMIDHAPEPSSAQVESNNLFGFYLSKLHRPQDFSFLMSGLLSHVYSALVPPSILPISFSLPIPKNPLDSSSTSASTASSESAVRTKPSGWTVEALTVLWRLIDGNKKFSTWLVRAHSQAGSGRWAEVVAVLESVKNEWRQDETQLGLVRLASFLIQTLTAETSTLALQDPSHAIALKQALNNPLQSTIHHSKWKMLVKRQIASAGLIDDDSTTLIEFLSMGAHSLILSPSSNKSGRLSTLYPSIVLSIDNLSPYIVELGNEASTRLVRIWLAFSAPSWVLMEEGNPRLLYYLLETFNNIVYHHLALNSRLLYALLQTHKRFELLSHFTLELGVSEARRLRAERRKRQQASSPHLEPVREGQETTATTLLSSPPATKSFSTSPRLSISSTFSTNSTPESPVTEEAPSLLSEKAAGKRRERSLSALGSVNLSQLSLNIDSGTSSGVEDPGPFVGKNGFVPTETWVASWREGLPLDPILVLLSELSPQISTCPTRTTALDVILTLTPGLVPLLPPAPTPKPRRFLLSPPLQTWFASTLYGKVYLNHLEYFREVVPVQLFGVQEAPQSHSRRVMSGGLGTTLGLDQVGRTVEEVGDRVGALARGVLGRVGGSR
ncbi:uncharacterized protein JCM15063_000114 [Sporobolomyces koalae]|uniref:uncharacterized protein n=1 Tax=Sporobolomyces koalae TaxID=500713 RepID=UPI003178243E